MDPPQDSTVENAPYPSSFSSSPSFSCLPRWQNCPGHTRTISFDIADIFQNWKDPPPRQTIEENVPSSYPSSSSSYCLRCLMSRNPVKEKWREWNSFTYQWASNHIPAHWVSQNNICMHRHSPFSSSSFSSSSSSCLSRYLNHQSWNPETDINFNQTSILYFPKKKTLCNMSAFASMLPCWGDRAKGMQ